MAKKNATVLILCLIGLVLNNFSEAETLTGDEDNDLVKKLFDLMIKTGCFLEDCPPGVILPPLIQKRSQDY